MGKPIEKQFEEIQNGIYKNMYYHIVPELTRFGIHMVNDVLPNQSEHRNLTGNTITSLAFGVYYMGNLEVMGFNNHYPPPIRNKLIKGEEVFDFEDYDGNIRKYFRAKIQTDAGYGTNTSMEFLKSYQSTRQFAIVFTTGTEYSEYLEKTRKLNVLSNGYDYSMTAFIKSFKPIRK